jgi:hypothetical protein
MAYESRSVEGTGTREESYVQDPTNRRSEHSRITGSARPSLSPYFVEDVAMTRSDVLRARNDDGPETADLAHVGSPPWVAVLAA